MKNIFKVLKDFLGSDGLAIWPFSKGKVNPAPVENEEVWMPITEFDGKYLASSEGYIKNTITGNVGKGTLNSRGYYVVHLTHNGKDYMRSVHRLIAEAFYGEIPSGMVIDHLNGNKLDNRIGNLKLTTRKGLSKENKAQRVVHRYTASVVQFDINGNELGRFKNANQAGLATKTSSSNIIAVCKNAYGRKTANGYVWKFEDDAQLPL